MSSYSDELDSELDTGRSLSSDYGGSDEVGGVFYFLDTIWSRLRRTSQPFCCTSK